MLSLYPLFFVEITKTLKGAVVFEARKSMFSEFFHLFLKGGMRFMKKKFTKVISCLLCLAMLASMAAPALAARADGEVAIDAPAATEDGGVLSQLTELPMEDVTAELLAADGEYEIYPTPHSVTYADPAATVTLPATMQVIYDNGIDDYTKARAVEAFEQAGVTLSESATDVKLQVRIDPESLPDKTSAHTVTVNASGVTVVGVDTDAAFYGLTTVKRILQQVQNRQVKCLTVEDYADVAFRGFIEGYYGNPWSTQDRIDLMEFGGELKMNIYFYAPKDDPKHNAKWRELYTEVRDDNGNLTGGELFDLIKPLAEAGERTKCRFGYALHCFMNSPFRFDTQEHYDEDLRILKAKYLQGIEAGARQIALLADDASQPSGSLGQGNEGGDGYVKLLNDLTDWLKSDEMQQAYPGLQTTIPFCPAAYGNGTGNHAQLKKLNDSPEGVAIIMTGGAIYGTVNSTFLNNFKNNVGRGAYLWVNWPVSDNHKSRLLMTGQDTFLKTGVDPDTVEGIMLNPMQQSEPSKVALFCNADYTWNIWATDQDGFDAWNDSFKYVENASAAPSAEADAFRLLSLHMGYGVLNGRPTTDESEELQPLLSAFRTAMNSDALTDAQISELRAEYVKIYEAAQLYKNKKTGNQRILGERDGDGYVASKEQVAPWLDCAEEFAQATIELLDVLALNLHNSDGAKDPEIVEKYLSAQKNLTASRSHKFWYRDHYETAEFGPLRLIPFTNDLMAKVAEIAKTIIDPSVLIETVITNRSDVTEAKLAAMRDGDESTIAVFDSPNSISVGTYIGLRFSKAITLNSVKFVTGASNANDRFNNCKLQYLGSSGDWTDIPNASFTHDDSILEKTGLNLSVRGVRVIATSERTNTYLGIKEIYVNGQSGGEPNEPTSSGEKYAVSAIANSDNMSVKGGTLNNAIDNSNNTDVQFAEYPYKGGAASTHDKVPADAWVRVDLGSEKAIGRIVIVQDNRSTGGDRMKDAILEYSTDGSAFTQIAGSLNTNTIDQEVNITARYIRLKNGSAAAEGWVRLADFSVYGPAPKRNDIDKIAYQSDTVKKLINPAGELADDSAALSADNVILLPGEFVGIALPGIRSITDIVADYTPAPGLVLMAGMNEAEMEVVSLNARAAYSGLARYIRLANEGSQTVSFRLNELAVTFDAAEAPEITFVETNIGTGDTYYSKDDARPNNKTGAWFDGDLSTVAAYATPHNEGEYVLYDLGQTMEISKLDAVIASTATNYVRYGEIQISPDGENWTKVVEIATTDNADGKGGFDTTPTSAGWANYPNVPNYSYKTGSITPTQARYLRLYITQTVNGGRFPALGEIVINDGAYVSAYSDPTIIADPAEPSADFTPDKLRDGDLTTGFQPNMTGRSSGSLTYRLSDQTAIGQINLVQGDTEGVKLSVRPTGQDNFVDPTSNASGAAALVGGLNQVLVSEGIANVAEIKLTWENVTPTFYELITVPRELVEEGGQAPSEEETIAINRYSGEGKINFDENWKFNLGDASGAQATVFNDSAWRTVNLPHDYSIEGEYTSAGEAESGYLIGGTGWYRKSFTVDPSWAGKTVTIDFGGVYMDCEVYLNGVKLGEHHYGYTPFSFVLSNLKTDGENVIAVKTDDSFPSSRWYSGAGIYRSVHLTVSDPVHVARYGTKVETTNDGAVTVKTTVQNDTNTAAAGVTVKQEIFELDSATYEKGAAVATDTSAATSVAANATQEVTQSLTVSSPKLWKSWDKGTPNLYVLVTTVTSGSNTHTYETEFGFRTIEFNKDTGFKLNGENVKLKGVCQHHDQGGLGSEAWYRALERQVDILMDMGCNSIRVTHNPAADELIEICNRKGILLIDEFFDGWAWPKNGNSGDFAKWFRQEIGNDNALVGKQSGDAWAKFVLQTVIKRDRNAPSIIMYSLGNEVQEGAGGYSWKDGNQVWHYRPAYFDVAKDLIQWAHEIDDSIILTRGSNGRDANASNFKAEDKTIVDDNGNAITGSRDNTTTPVSHIDGAINALIAASGGIVGFNYGSEGTTAAGHNQTWPMYSSETASAVNSRGVYNIKDSQALNSDKLLTSYDKSAVGWGAVASDAWWRTIRYDYNMGEYVWTGFDYIGEPTPNNRTGTGWANGEDSPKSSFFGIIDTNGLPKDSYYMYRSMWNDQAHTLHILPTWDREDLMIDADGKVEVVVYTDAPMVKLYLNNVEIGSATSASHASDTGLYTYRTWDSGTDAFVQKSGHQSLYATFNVTYAEGTLRAVACDENGQPLNWVTQGRKEVKTTSGAAKLTAVADRTTIKNDGRDLSYITISVTDASGEIVNGAKNAITVSVEGDGKFMAMDNGVQPDHTSYLSKTRKAGAGQVVAVVQSTKDKGQFTLTATADGLTPATVTVKTDGVTSAVSPTDPVSYDLAKTIYVQKGIEPDLPETVPVTLGNKTTVDKAVTWDETWDKGLLNTVGSEFAITGVIDDYNISVSVGVVVLDQVVALLNYSTALQVGGTLTLPNSRPAVMADGTVVNAQFAVDWDPVGASLLAQPGTVIVNGTAEVFGKEMSVTATVRVAQGVTTELGNVISVAHLDRNDNASALENLRDGSETTVWTGSGAVVFEYDTSFNLSKVNLTYSGSASTSGVTIYTSDNGSEWTRQTARPTTDGSTVTYALPSLPGAVFVKLEFANEVTISEVGLISGTSVFPVGATAALDNLTVNGASVSDAQLAARVIRTPLELAAVVPVSDKNVAVTILPEKGNKIIVVTEAEDQSARDMYTVVLGAPDVPAADDDSRDYPYGQTTATAGSDNGNTVGSAVDGNTDTIWHSAYNNGSTEANASDKLAGFPEKRWFQLELQEATDLVALRYKPRPSQANGTVKDYRIETSMDGTTWTTIAEGTWDSSADWKIASFNHAIKAKYVKLWGVNTYGDGSQANYFMAAAEVRVVKAPEDDGKTDLAFAVVTPEYTEAHWRNVNLRPKATVTLYGETLTEGVDYTLEYRNNKEPGTAYVYAYAVEGSNYKGSAFGTFQIIRINATIESFQPTNRFVREGKEPQLPTEIFAEMSDGHTTAQAVTWDYIDPALYTNPTNNTFTVSGTVLGTDIVPVATVHLSLATAVDGVSALAAIGTAPTLPAKVTVRFDDGTFDEYPVTWDLTGKDWNTAGIVEVTGAVEGIARVTAKASVRVAAADQPTGNLALNASEQGHNGQGHLTSIESIFPMAIASESSGDNNPYHVLKGQTTGSTVSTDRWSDWQKGNIAHSSAWVGVAFETSTENVTHKENQVLTLVPHVVNKAKIMFVDENANNDGQGAVTYPDSYTIEYYDGPVNDLTFNTQLSGGDSGGGNGRVDRSWASDSPLKDSQNWKSVQVKGSQPAVPSSRGQWVEVEFEPVSTAILRVKCTPKTSKWVGVQALEVYGLTAAAKSTFTPSLSFTARDEQYTLDNFTAGVKEITVDLRSDEAIPQITASTLAEDNASVAITQATRVPGGQYAGGAWATVTFTAEDGVTKETYTIKFTRAGQSTTTYTLTKRADTDSRITLTANGTTIPGTGATPIAPGTVISIGVPVDYKLTNAWAMITSCDHEGNIHLGNHLDILNNQFTMPDLGDIEFSAEVTPITYQITYDLGGGQVEHNPTSFDVENNPFTLHNPTREGYTFLGWVCNELQLQGQMTVTVDPQASSGWSDLTFVAMWKKNDSGSSGGNGGGGSSVPAGDVTTTTKNPDGSTTVTTTTPSGLVSSVTTQTDGTQSAVIQIPKNSGSDVTAVMPKLDVTADKTPEVTVENKTGRSTTVTVPVTGGDTIVAVRQNADGTETVIPYSIVDESGLRIKLEAGDQSLKLVDNKKAFEDVPAGHWAASPVDFVSSRELFNGMGTATTFAPTVAMDRAMMTTVLWRLAEKPDTAVEDLFDDVVPGSYYEPAVAWGVKTGVVKGTDNGFEPNAPVTREMLAVLLYRAAGSPAVVDEMPRRFADGAQVADWAQEAMIWCIQNDIIKGYPDNTLGSKNVATRAEVATMLQRFVDHQV